jgi:plasmid stabilization system protein ParE
MTYRVLIQARAEQEIREYAFWLHRESRSAAVALRWARGIRSQIGTLKTHPLRCPVDPDSDAYGEEVRVLLHGKGRGIHRVLFAVRGREVHVLTVRHAARRSLEEERGGDEPGDTEEAAG